MSTLATLVVQSSQIRRTRTPPPLSSTLTIDTSKFKSHPVPNKHIPYCSPGPAPSTPLRTPATPPASPPIKAAFIQNTSILHPVDNFSKLVDNPPIYSIDAATLAKALNNASTQPLPDPRLVFPWMHGLHPENQTQLAFFLARRKAIRKTPKGIRGITIVKTGGKLTKSKLKGAMAPNELLSMAGSRDPAFHEVDPKDGFSVRNFHIQAAKTAMVSDIVVYGDDDTKAEDIRALARRISRAQKSYSEKCDINGLDGSSYNTFVMSSKIITIRSFHHQKYITANNTFQVLSKNLQKIIPTWWLLILSSN